MERRPYDFTIQCKKPYTVVVAIVLVLILGVVSFGKMNTDLLPSMNLPYAIVMTTYQGASPETVETVVTKPVEQSMATVTDIENVSSQSRENVSLVILEFQGLPIWTPRLLKYGKNWIRSADIGMMR